MIKYCKKCNSTKPLSDFHNDQQRKDGKYIYCKDCHYAYMRNRYHHKPGVREQHLNEYKQKRANDLQFVEDAKIRGAKHYNSTRGRIMTLLRGAYRRDKNATVTFKHLHDMLLIGRCPVTNIAFDLSSNYRVDRHQNPYSPSLDQIVAGGGYTNENTRLVIWQYNLMKGQLSDAEIFIICNSVVRNSLWT